MAKKKQAVVIIHGIGEQRPMKTLRGFVTSLLSYEKYKENDTSTERTFWTKPDRISNSYELRKIVAKGLKGKRSTTHFYEYHWASNMRDTKWKHILNWFKALMFRNPYLSKSLRLVVLWSALWFTVVSWFMVLAKVLHDCLTKSYFSFDALTAYEITLLALPILMFLLHNFFIGFVGDAARYLRVDADNIQQRETIRRNGVDLLKALHKTGDYDRIVLVGHSLGSVIAYDILTYLWIDFNKAIDLNQNKDFDVSKENDWGCTISRVSEDNKFFTKVVDWSRKADRNEEFSFEEMNEFQSDQSNLWSAIQHERKSWLVTDLITLGSPLNHAKLLMADSNRDFAFRIDEREYPICPPILDGNDLTYPSSSGEQCLHHATPFAVTRWSNLYYKGDFIGGKLRDKFGLGINDSRLNYSGHDFNRLTSYISPLTHVNYWINKTVLTMVKNRREYDPIKTLYEKMRLNDIESDVYKASEGED